MHMPCCRITAALYMSLHVVPHRWRTDLLRPASSTSLSSSSERAPETLLLIDEGMAGSCKESTTPEPLPIHCFGKRAARGLS